MTEPWPANYTGNRTSCPRPSYTDRDGNSKPFEYWQKQQAENLRAGIGDYLFEYLDGTYDKV